MNPGTISAFLNATNGTDCSEPVSHMVTMPVGGILFFAFFVLIVAWIALDFSLPEEE